MTDEKKKYQQSGKLTLVSDNFISLLGCNTFVVFCTIQHNDDVRKYNVLSTTVIMIHTGLCNKTVISSLRDLNSLKIIEKKHITHRGTPYIIRYDVINKYKSQLDAITSPVERLKQADSIRVANGLKPINESLIKAYSNTTFDVIPPAQDKQEKHQDTTQPQTPRQRQIQTVINRVNDNIRKHKQGLINDDAYHIIMNTDCNYLKQTKIRIHKNEDGTISAIYN